GGVARTRRAPPHHHADPREGTGQPAPGDGRAPLLPPVVRDVPLDDRPQDRPPGTPDPRGRRHVPLLHAPDRVRDLARRDPRPLEHGRRLRRFVRHERDHLDRRRRDLDRDGLRDRLRRLHRDDVRPAGRHPGEARMRPGRVAGAALLALLALGPFLPMGGMRQYILHVLIQILIWSFIGGAWSVMGRFGLVSLGHGAFLGLGAYTVTLLWHFYSLTPWMS